MSTTKTKVPGRKLLVFRTEHDFCNYIAEHITEFCRDVLDTDLISYKRESYLVRHRFGVGNKPRIDFDIHTSAGRVLVECKNPSQTFAEMTRAISQLLAYSTFVQEDCRLVLATSANLQIVQEIIYKYKLPIMVALILPDMVATWDASFQDDLLQGVVTPDSIYKLLS